MSAAQDIHDAARAGDKGPRRLAVARHAHGVDALGWVLLGFVMGAGAAIAVLVNADFGRREPGPTMAIRQSPPLRFEIAPVARQPTLILPPAPSPAFLGPVAGLAPKTPQPPAAKPPAGPAHKPAAASEAVADDAAAAGMTSRVEGRDSDLY